MKFVLIVILLFAYLKSTSQTYDTIASNYFSKGKIINKIDSLGQKQGEWICYQMYTYPKITEHYNNSTETDTSFKKSSQGSYLNDKKIGIWAYFHDGGCSSWTIKKEEYFPNGAVQETNYDLFAITDFAPDSSFVHSSMIVNKDTIHIECQNKRNCIVKFKENELYTFDLKHLEFEQFRISMGAFASEIIDIKNSDE
ncbi:MAG: hypothetical protein K1X55_11395 [Chitinophagales bacterium]|nr:hypothetical protein [Chitinophagales bacterium]